MTLGLTGGMGCGKTAAAALFENRGFRRIDSDGIVRDQALTDPHVQTALQQRFGPAVLKEGKVDRKTLAAQVFTSDKQRLWIEELIHPVVFASWRRMITTAPDADWIIEVPLLFEKRLENWFDFTICVACAPDTQLARLEQRGLPRALAEQRISKQLPLAQKIELADFVLWNDGTPEFLQDQISRLIKSLPVVR